MLHEKTKDIWKSKRSYLMSSSASLVSEQLMIEGTRISLEHASSELRLKKGAERVQVRRGHIARSIGKKDRHSKDRLGYDRPSKAVDWLMEKAKTAIDALAELPTQCPLSTSVVASAQQREQNLNHLQHPHLCVEQLETILDLNQQHLNENPIYSSGLFHIPVSTAFSAVHFQNSPAYPNLGAISHTQYPYLSIQSFQDPTLGRHHSTTISSADQAIYSASSPLVFDAASNHWPHSDPPEMSQPQKMIDWNSDTGNGIQGLVFDSLPLPLQEPALSQNQLFSEREPLQSTDSALISDWMNPPISTANVQHITKEANQSSGFALASNGISRIGISAHIQGEDMEQSTV
ncbi:transcription factor TCP4-like [Vitis riparia]|uniref:transcription factor TCP4-like n=1 Tax=Vitis riparia TaxID=96939 RepID=UPI00155A3801|nr:transcription factor TCP4-like [Vitis riparia]